MRAASSVLSPPWVIVLIHFLGRDSPDIAILALATKVDHYNHSGRGVGKPSPTNVKSEIMSWNEGNSSQAVLSIETAADLHNSVPPYPLWRLINNTPSCIGWRRRAIRKISAAALYIITSPCRAVKQAVGRLTRCNTIATTTIIYGYCNKY
jgi:hypothetical protein